MTKVVSATSLVFAVLALHVASVDESSAKRPEHYTDFTLNNGWNRQKIIEAISELLYEFSPKKTLVWFFSKYYPFSVFFFKYEHWYCAGRNCPARNISTCSDTF